MLSLFVNSYAVPSCCFIRFHVACSTSEQNSLLIYEIWTTLVECEQNVQR
jgi:hypothetical protein